MSRSGTPRIPDAWCLALGLSLGASALISCRVERDRADGGSFIHPMGYAEVASPAFHGTELATSGYPLGDCRVCHGQQYEGGLVAPSCVTSDCHSAGVEACGSCHGIGTDPEPGTDAHLAHEDCETCHPPRTDARSAAHPDGLVDIAFTGLALHGGAVPGFDSGTRVCSDVYCHGGRDVVWQAVPGGLGCDACHDSQPELHAGFNDGSPETCGGCHPASDHLDGTVQTFDLGCDACHGSGPLGAPAPAIDGATDSSDPGVGAHRRHLDPTLADRIGSVARCDQCHVVPKSIDSPGHLDSGGQAEVLLWKGGSYEPSEQRCVSACHFNKDPGPVWTDDSGAERACDACHEAAPTKALDGSAHPKTEPGLAACVACHVFDPSTHVDGKVDLK
jgi:predicted CxxxxCH...CXXCH cytochrome family protein